MDEQRTDVRIYPVQIGDEPVMLSPNGRIVPSIVWYGEGGPNREKRRYTSEEAALKKEMEQVSGWFVRKERENYNYVPEVSRPVFKQISRDRFTVAEKSGKTEVDTGFTVEKSGDVWRVLYDGVVWGITKEWENVYTVVGHIFLYTGEMIAKGPNILKEFIASYTWEDRDGSKILLNKGKPTGVTVRPGPGGFHCYYRDGDACPEDIFPSLEEAQIEAKLRYTGAEFRSIMGNIIIEDETGGMYEP
jgi:hypothetical protein